MSTKMMVVFWTSPDSNVISLLLNLIMLYIHLQNTAVLAFYDALNNHATGQTHYRILNSDLLNNLQGIGIPTVHIT